MQHNSFSKPNSVVCNLEKNVRGHTFSHQAATLLFRSNLSATKVECRSIGTTKISYPDLLLTKPIRDLGSRLDTTKHLSAATH